MRIVMLLSVFFLVAAPSAARAEETFAASIASKLRLVDAPDRTIDVHLVPALASPVSARSEGGILPCVLSIIPGLGQVFNGDYLKGLAFFLAVGIASGVGKAIGGAVGWALGALAFGLWVLNLVDAYTGGSTVAFGSGGDARPEEAVQVIFPDVRPAT